MRSARAGRGALLDREPVDGSGRGLSGARAGTGKLYFRSPLSIAALLPITKNSRTEKEPHHVVCCSPFCRGPPCQSGDRLAR
ncbi:hypothetical protein PT2222_480004 [Paraburkholderia tropica]